MHPEEFEISAKQTKREQRMNINKRKKIDRERRESIDSYHKEAENERTYRGRVQG